MEFSPSILASNNFLELDHICIYLPNGLQGALILQEFGFYSIPHVIRRVEQGTMSRIILFENAYLELISIDNEDTAQQHAVQTGVDILKRAHWEQTGVSPFGISLRRCQPINLKSGCDGKCNEWIPSETFVNFATENLLRLAEPFCFIIPDFLALTNWLDLSSPEHQALVSHSLGIKTLTRIKIVMNDCQELSNAISLISSSTQIAIEKGSFPLLELTFDHMAMGRTLDIQPALPIIIHY